MAWLKVYEWERKRWPEFRMVQIDRERQATLVRKLAKHFKVDEPGLSFSYKLGVASGWGGGSYRKGYPDGATIKVGKVTTLGTLCHEFAHHLDWRRHGGYGHRRSFKRELKRVYTWAKRYLPEKVE